MVRRGSTVRVRQRASIKCLQLGTLLLSARRTRGHISDTSGVRATHRDVSRRLLTRLAGTDAARFRGKTPAHSHSRCLSWPDRDPLRAREGVGGSSPPEGFDPCPAQPTCPLPSLTAEGIFDAHAASTVWTSAGPAPVIAALHQAAQRESPLTLTGAGLPQLPVLTAALETSACHCLVPACEGSTFRNS